MVRAARELLPCPPTLEAALVRTDVPTQWVSADLVIRWCSETHGAGLRRSALPTTLRDVPKHILARAVARICDRNASKQPSPRSRVVEAHWGRPILIIALGVSA